MPCPCVLLACIGLPIWDGAPRTIHFEIDEWENKSWGLHAIDRRAIRCVTAVSASGSRANQCNSELFHHYFVPYDSGSLHTIYQGPLHSGYSIDDEHRTARGGECSCWWELVRQKADDSTCCQTADELLPGGKYVGSDRIAGRFLVQYQKQDDDDGVVHELALAPELGCEVMEQLQRWPGTLGIPGAEWRYRVTSYQAGEPDGSLFQVPAGYAIEQMRE